MAQKPTVSLPDVFAKPGRAPSRGTPIEDLPASATLPDEQAVVEPTASADAVSAAGPVAYGTAPGEGAPVMPETPIVAAAPVPSVSEPVTVEPVSSTEAPATEIAKAAEVEAAQEPSSAGPTAPTDAMPSDATGAKSSATSLVPSQAVSSDVPATDKATTGAEASSHATPAGGAEASAAPGSPMSPGPAEPHQPAAASAPPAQAAPMSRPQTVTEALTAPASPQPIEASGTAEQAAPISGPATVAEALVTPTAPASPQPVVASPPPAPITAPTPSTGATVAPDAVLGPAVASPIVPSPAPSAAATVAGSPSVQRVTPGSGSPPIMTSPQMSQAANPMPASGPNSTWGIAVAALVVGLTVPIWQDPVQRMLGITTAVSRAQQEDSLTLARLERKAQDLEQRLVSTSTQLTKAQADLAQAARRHEDAAAWLRAMALTRLGDALRRSSPFGPDLAVARGAGVNLDDIKPMLDKIGPFTSTGVPTTADLDREFRRMADQITRTGRGLVPAEWMATLVSWTSFNRAPPPPADPAPDLVRAAAANVADGNYAAAIEQLKLIAGPYEQVFAGWIEDVQARMAADSIVKRVDEAVDRAVRPAAK